MHDSAFRDLPAPDELGWLAANTQVKHRPQVVRQQLALDKAEIISQRMAREAVRAGLSAKATGPEAGSGNVSRSDQRSMPQLRTYPQAKVEASEHRVNSTL